MKAQDIRQKSSEELTRLLEEKKRRRYELTELLRDKKVKNVKELDAVKKDIARILTIMREIQVNKNYE